MNILDIIKNRASTRAYLNKDVDKKTIIKILDTARWAPSGVNTQPWEVVVLSKEKINLIGSEIIKAREANIKENPDYKYYPTTWEEPYKTRRKECGNALYSSLGINIEDTERRKKQWYLNYYFFNAPVGLLFFIDSKLEKGSWLDCGMFIQNVMLAAKHFNLETCPEASMSEYPDIVRKHLNISKNKSLICGMALGYPDLSHPVNNYRTSRLNVDEFTKFI